MRHKRDIELKLRELQSSIIYFRDHRSPLNADEAKLKAEALKWVLGETDTI